MADRPFSTSMFRRDPYPCKDKGEKPGVDEDWQKGEEMMSDQFLNKHGVIQMHEDTEIRCPECKESMTLPAPISELDFYQCHDCGYMIDLRQESMTLGGLERLNQAIQADNHKNFACADSFFTAMHQQMKVWPTKLFGLSPPIAILTEGGHICCLDCYVAHEEDDALVWEFMFGLYSQSCFFCRKVLVKSMGGWKELFL